MRILSDQVEIFSFLEANGLADFDPRKNYTHTFTTEKQQCLLLFCAAGKNCGTRLFLLPLSAASIEIELQLLPAILSLDGDEAFLEMRDLALDAVASLIEQKKAKSFFLDAH